MNIYLDVDGVILTKRGEPAKHIVKFLEAVTKHDCYWLTTHCKGDAKELVRILEKRLPVEATPFLHKIQSTNWQTWKTEAIDFSQDFLWFDDNPMEAERKVLEHHHCVDKLVLIDLINNPDQLSDLSVF